MEILIERPYIVYSLTGSKVYQQLKSKNVQVILKELNTFLENISTTKLLEPKEFKIRLHPLLSRNKINPLLNEILENSKITGKHEWLVNSEHLLTSIDCLEQTQPSIKTDLDFNIRYLFRLVDPNNKKQLQNQQFDSSLNIYLSKTKTCNPTLFFPFTESNQKFWNYIDTIKQYLPFDLDEKYIKLVRIKNGRISSFKKVERPVEQKN